MAVADLVSGAEGKGIRDYGLADHVHTPFNLPDLAASRKEYDENRPAPSFHFGVEASCVSQWEIDEIVSGRYQGRPPVYGLRAGGPPNAAPAIALTADGLREHRVEYVIGGAHWPLYVPSEREALIRNYHRQNMFLAEHPLVDIVAHPWWWQGQWRDPDGRYTTEPWMDDFRKVPRSLHDEFAAAVLQHGKVVEVNLGAMLLTRKYADSFKRQYLDYLADLKERHVPLCAGSDCHSEQYDTDFALASEMLGTVGIRDDDLWRLPPRREEAEPGREQ
jgi:hypothetical protein